MIYRFGACELDESKGELRRDGRVVPIQPKPLALLTLLLAERDRIVSNDELFERLWTGETVTPSSLSRAVSVARSAIGDRGRSGWIRCYTRRGYRFHGDVVELEPDGAAPVAGAPVADGAGDALPFVGREDALARLRAAWGRAARGRGGIAVISGPPGIGKSRLSEVFEAEVAARGGLALRGRALEEEGEPAFWVWAQVLRRLQHEDPEALREPGLAVSDELAALLPELAAPTPGAAARLPAEQRRFVFFDSVARALRGAARKRPLLIVFEDLHWADPSSLRLLEHLVFELTGAPVLLLATARDGAADRNEDSARTLSVLARHERCETLELKRLDTDAIALAVERLHGRPDRSLAERLLAHTDGVPLFLREALRRLSDRSASARLAAAGEALPLGRVAWVEDALATLPSDCAQLVGAAAVVGRDFALPLVAEAAGVSRDAALDLLDEACRAGVVEPARDDPARYRFVHALFREAAYTALPNAARVRLHRQVAAGLERRHAADEERVIAELAHHHHRSLAVGDPERAFACAVRAAQRAFTGCAYEQALQHRLQALAALDHADAPDPLRRLATLLELGEAARLSGERRERRRWFGEALALARRLERPAELAAAAIGLCELAEWGVRDDVAHSALEEALERLDPPDPELEAKILTRLGYLDSLFDRARAEQLLRRAVRQTRELGASEPLEEALYALHFLLGGPEGHAERLEILEELRGAASAARDPVASVIAVLDVACDRLERGDAEGTSKLRREADAIAGNPPHPRTIWHRHVFDTGLALMQGRLGEVEGRADEAAELGRRIQHPYAAGCRLAHVAALHRERGEHAQFLAHMEPTLVATQGPTHWVKLCVARALLAAGDAARADDLYRSAIAGGPGAIPRNLRWISSMVELAHACADFEDAETAVEVAAALAAFEPHHGVMPMVISYGGPVAWALARLEELRGRADDADALYADALVAAAGLGAQPTEARIRLDHGRLLRRRARRSEARAQLAAAAALAADLGLADVERAACAQLER